MGDYLVNTDVSAVSNCGGFSHWTVFVVARELIKLHLDYAHPTDQADVQAGACCDVMCIKRLHTLTRLQMQCGSLKLVLTSKEGQDAHSNDALAARAAGEAQGDQACQDSQQHTRRSIHTSYMEPTWGRRQKIRPMNLLGNMCRHSGDT